MATIQSAEWLKVVPNAGPAPPVACLLERQVAGGDDNLVQGARSDQRRIAGLEVTGQGRFWCCNAGKVLASITWRLQWVTPRVPALPGPG